MATPYFQRRLDRVPSTQDVAREEFDGLPLLVIAAAQTEGRGRSGAEWLTAERALAASLAFRPGPADLRPFSLMAGVAAVRAAGRTSLKWPNDLLGDDAKVGGILVEQSAAVTVIGLGLNLWWPDAPGGIAGLDSTDPGEERHAEVGALWGAELLELIESDVWPSDEYRRACSTLGKAVTWEPGGEGTAIDVADDGGLVVETASGIETLRSGAIRHLRT